MDVAERYELLWLDLQKELTARSTNSANIIVRESGHVIHDEAPDALIKAVKRLLCGGSVMADRSGSGDELREKEDWRTLIKIQPAGREQI